MKSFDRAHLPLLEVGGKCGMTEGQCLAWSCDSCNSSSWTAAATPDQKADANPWSSYRSLEERYRKDGICFPSEVGVLFSVTHLWLLCLHVHGWSHTSGKALISKRLDTGERTQVQIWFRDDWSDGAGGMGIWIYTNACFMDLLVWASKEKIPMLILL